MAGAQWTYEKSPAYLGSGPLPPALARVLLPSVKLVAILRNPTSRAYSAFQHNCRFGRWRTTTATAATTTTTKGERGKSNMRGGGRSASSGGGSSGGDSSGSGGLIVNCDAGHDEKFARSKPSATTTEPGAGGSQDSYDCSGVGRREVAATVTVTTAVEVKATPGWPWRPSPN